MSKERPIIFQGWGVNAILKDLKTQTRRLLKPQPTHELQPDSTPQCGHREWMWRGKLLYPTFCPYGEPGDLLWVRETHYRYGKWLKNGRTKTGRQRWKFKALSEGCWYFDDPPVNVRPNTYRREGFYKRASIHMPRWASRITLKIVSVRVEQVQEIGMRDCVAEGVDTKVEGHLLSAPQLRSRFRALWDSIHAKKGHGFDANDWVWRIEFKRIKE